MKKSLIALSIMLPLTLLASIQGSYEREVTTNVYFDADNICRHAITTNIYTTIDFADGTKQKINLSHINKIYDSFVSTPDGRVKIHGKKLGVVVGDGVVETTYQDGFVYRAKMVKREATPPIMNRRVMNRRVKTTTSKPVFEFTEEQKKMNRAVWSSRREDLAKRRKEAQSVTNEIFMIFTAGGKVVSITTNKVSKAKGVKK